ncbi:MAG: alpha/beta hydrolase, partial [Prevotella sp.]
MLNTHSLRLFLVVAFTVLCFPVWAQQKYELDLWNGKPDIKSDDNSDTAKVWVYLPKKEEAVGRAVIICPGGGYKHLAMNHEGHDWAPFFNNMGIAAIVLKYRMPNGNKDIPISDAEEAIRMVRRNATKWGINTKDIGIMGSSAGGHLASTVATHAKGDAKP